MTDYDPYWPQYLEKMFGSLDVLEQAKKELAFMNKYNDLIKESQDILNSFIGYVSTIPPSVIDTLKLLPATQDYIRQVASTFEKALPYMDSKQEKKYKEEVLPKLKRSIEHKLSISDLIAIISLIVAIYFGIISSLPDEQLDRISQQSEVITKQNAVIIEQQKEIIEFQQEDLKLRDTLDSPTDSINMLSDQVQSLREEIERSNDLSKLDSQFDAESRENKDDQN